MSYKGRIAPGISSLEAAEWDRCLPGEAEGWAYYGACEISPPAGIRIAAAVVEDSAGLVAAAPLFQLAYRLDTPLQGVMRPLADWLARWFPRLIEWRLLGIGSPFAERAHIAVRPDLPEGEQTAALAALAALVEDHAQRTGTSLIAYKDVAPGDLPRLGAVLGKRYCVIRSLPLAVLDIPADGIEGYLARLSAGTRKDVRRKLRKAAELKIEHRTAIDDLLPTIEALYASTQTHSNVHYGDFEELPAGYFQRIAELPEGKARFVLYWVGAELAAFNLLLVEKDRVIDKFLGMAYPLATDHNIYVISWMENVRYCHETDRSLLQTGQTAYRMKLRMGSRLVESKLFVRHRNPVLNWAIGLLAPLLAFDRWDPELRLLKDDSK